MIALPGMLVRPGPATAQLSPSIELTSDYRLRGYSLSGGHPAVSAGLAYDDASGLFADGSAHVQLSSGDGARWLGGVAAIGYAARLDDRWSVDIGALRAQYSRFSSLGRAAGYTELFAGISGRSVSAHVSLSPDYFSPGVTTVYGRVDAVRRLGHIWRLFGHAGVMSRLGATWSIRGARTQYDWRAGVRLHKGIADADIALSGGGPGWDHYQMGGHSRTVLVGTIRLQF